MSNTLVSEPIPKTKSISTEKMIRLYSLFVSLSFLIATPFAVIYAKEWNFWENLNDILFSPCKLVTDYFALGGLGSTLFNAAICGLITNAVVYISKVHANATTFAGYMLVVAHCFYGLNFFYSPYIF